jgi:hypothetical protein
MKTNLLSHVAVCADKRVAEDELHGRSQARIEGDQVNGSIDVVPTGNLLRSLFKKNNFMLKYVT